MLVPRPPALRMFNEPFRFFTLARMLTKPNPSLIPPVLAIPDPLFSDLENQIGSIQAQTDVNGVGSAWRIALLIASCAIRSKSWRIPTGRLTSFSRSERKVQRSRPGIFERSGQHFQGLDES